MIFIIMIMIICILIIIIIIIVVVVVVVVVKLSLLLVAPFIAELVGKSTSKYALRSNGSSRQWVKWAASVWVSPRLHACKPAVVTVVSSS